MLCSAVSSIYRYVFGYTAVQVMFPCFYPVVEIQRVGRKIRTSAIPMLMRSSSRRTVTLLLHLLQGRRRQSVQAMDVSGSLML